MTWRLGNSPPLLWPSLPQSCRLKDICFLHFLDHNSHGFALSGSRCWPTPSLRTRSAQTSPMEEAALTASSEVLASFAQGFSLLEPVKRVPAPSPPYPHPFWCTKSMSAPLLPTFPFLYHLLEHHALSLLCSASFNRYTNL